MWVLMTLVNFIVPIKFLFFLSDAQVCSSNFSSTRKRILIFIMADWVLKISVMFKNYQNQLNECNCTLHVSLTVFVTIVLNAN